MTGHLKSQFRGVKPRKNGNEKVRFRSPVPEYSDQDMAKDKWHVDTIQPRWMSDAAEVQRQSHCTLEVDVRVEDIMNRREIRPRYIHHDFMERFQELKYDEKFVHSMAPPKNGDQADLNPPKLCLI